MTHEQLPEDCLLFAQDRGGNFAMACIAFSHIITADHVARGQPNFLAPRTGEMVRVPLTTVAMNRDLALSSERALVRGFDRITSPEVGQTLFILGYHGLEHTPFSITVTVKRLMENGRVIVERLKGAVVQVGMSGSVAVTEKNELVGILVEGVAGTNGEQLYLETVESLFRS